jgi:hypothetical protein
MAGPDTTKPATACGEPTPNFELLGGGLNPSNNPHATKTQPAPLIGLKIRLRRTIDVPCGECGETVVVIGDGAGPHIASLRCAACNRHRGWLPKTVAEFLLETIARFGRPSEIITIQNSEFASANEAAPSGAIAAPTTFAP